MSDTWPEKSAESPCFAGEEGGREEGGDGSCWKTTPLVLVGAACIARLWGHKEGTRLGGARWSPALIHGISDAKKKKKKNQIREGEIIRWIPRHFFKKSKIKKYKILLLTFPERWFLKSRRFPFVSLNPTSAIFCLLLSYPFKERKKKKKYCYSSTVIRFSPPK